MKIEPSEFFWDCAGIGVMLLLMFAGVGVAVLVASWGGPL